MDVVDSVGWGVDRGVGAVVNSDDGITFRTDDVKGGVKPVG